MCNPRGTCDHMSLTGGKDERRWVLWLVGECGKQERKDWITILGSSIEKSRRERCLTYVTQRANARAHPRGSTCSTQGKQPLWSAWDSCEVQACDLCLRQSLPGSCLLSSNSFFFSSLRKSRLQIARIMHSLSGHLVRHVFLESTAISYFRRAGGEESSGWNSVWYLPWKDSCTNHGGLEKG